jgi:glycosyltransferase involved in cell wall biosynthesis
MRVALIADAFPPLRSSGAVQLRDLSLEFVKQGHDVTMMVAAPELDASFRIEDWRGVRIVRLKTPKTKDIGYVRRTINEFLMPFAMLRNLHRSPLSAARWDGVVWYSPTIFLGPMVSALKRPSACRSYLIIRDIFPEWAADMGLMGRGLPYRMFKLIANYQYSVADVIGIQTAGNRTYFTDWLSGPHRRVEVLQNWLANSPAAGCSVSINKTSLAGRKIFVYAGNMGVAQGMGILFDLAEQLRDRTDLGFLFVGRGSDAQRLRSDANERRLENVIFFDEIDPDEIPGLYAQCHVGLVALDPRHKTHNIPGKFLSYMQAGLPVLASINPGNDLVGLISEKQVGRVCTDNLVDNLVANALELIDTIGQSNEIKNRCRALAVGLFSPETAVKQIVSALESA